MRLTEKLAEKKEAVLKNIPTEKWEIMESSTKKLKDAKLSYDAIKTGDTITNFNLPDVNNRLVKLTDLKKDYLIISFYRGGWCPYCNLELKALQNILPELSTLNTELVAISPETPDNSLSTSEKNKLTFTVLSDIDNKYAKSLGLVFKMPEDLRSVYTKLLPELF